MPKTDKRSCELCLKKMSKYELVALRQRGYGRYSLDFLSGYGEPNGKCKICFDCLLITMKEYKDRYLEAKYECDHCGEFFTTEEEIAKHKSDVEPPEIFLVCCECGDTFAPEDIKGYRAGDCTVRYKAKKDKEFSNLCIWCYDKINNLR
jgi:hypothetical protein